MIKKLINALLFNIIVLLCLSVTAQTTNINREWRFTFGDPMPAAASTTYDDSSWQHISLPHSMSMPYFRSKDFYVGYGWYRKTIDVTPQMMGKYIVLNFDGVFQSAQVYVNGELSGEHQGGYIGFSINITPQVVIGKNTIAVRVNNLWNAQLAPRAGEHVFAGGIYRDVYLRVTDPLHISNNGIAVTTPTVSKQSGTVQIQTSVCNTASETENCKVTQTIRNASGKKIETFAQNIEVGVGKTVTISQTSQQIATPELWSPQTPTLYSVETTITSGGKVVDRQSTQFGFRWCTWSADKGFFLNGEHLYLEGANVHQDHAGWGDAVTQAGIYRDVKMIKDAGFNLIRGSHYPHHPYFAQVCDELGMLFISENNVWGIGGHKPDGYWDSSVYPPDEADQKQYEATARESLVKMIDINRNHPSIIAWSMCNEPFFTYPVLMDKVKALLIELVALSHQTDPSRIALIGGAQRGGIDILGDGAGYNGDGATIYRNPGIVNMVSEYGSCVTDRPGDYDPCWGHVTDGEKPAWRAGHVIWCGFDHGSIAGDMGKMGIIDFFRIPKKSWYWYRNHNLGIAPPEWAKPGIAAGLRLSSDKSQLASTNGTDDALILVEVVDKAGVALSNSPAVTFTIESGPGEFPTGRSITFRPTTADDIRIQDGKAAIEFRSYEGGKSRIRATSEGLQDAVIEIQTLGLPRYQDGATPLVQSRAYNPDSVYRQTKAELVKVSHRRPSVVSSGNGAFANDGSANTVWRSESDDKSPWWKLDMENFYKVSNITINTIDDNQAIVSVEVSADDKTWTRIAQSTVKGESTIKCNTDVKGRFLRLTFTNSWAAISEVEVFAY